VTLVACSVHGSSRTTTESTWPRRRTCNTVEGPPEETKTEKITVHVWRRWIDRRRRILTPCGLTWQNQGSDLASSATMGRRGQLRYHIHCELHHHTQQAATTKQQAEAVRSRQRRAAASTQQTRASEQQARREASSTTATGKQQRPDRAGHCRARPPHSPELSQGIVLRFCCDLPLHGRGEPSPQPHRTALP
jgi:hypothetical protein